MVVMLRWLVVMRKVVYNSCYSGDSVCALVIVWVGGGRY